LTITEKVSSAFRKHYFPVSICGFGVARNSLGQLGMRGEFFRAFPRPATATVMRRCHSHNVKLP
jgi:hypothetical protein